MELHVQTVPGDGGAQEGALWGGADLGREGPLRERGGEELCPRVWPGWCQVPSSDNHQMAHCVLRTVISVFETNMRPSSLEVRVSHLCLPMCALLTIRGNGTFLVL